MRATAAALFAVNGVLWGAILAAILEGRPLWAAWVCVAVASLAVFMAADVASD
jgi:urea transporter